MHRYLVAALLAVGIVSAPAQAQSTDLGFVPKEMSVTLLNKGGKRQVVQGLSDMKKLWEKKAFDKVPEGGTCRIPTDALIHKAGVSETLGMTRVVYLYPQTQPGECPFWTIFDVPTSVYEEALKRYNSKMKSEM